jgi:hypothetical protein
VVFLAYILEEEANERVCVQRCESMLAIDNICAYVAELSADPKNLKSCSGIMDRPKSITKSCFIWGAKISDT